MHRRSRSGRHHHPVRRFERVVDALLVLVVGPLTFRWALGW